jgi:alcohol dehydrogenase
MSDTESTQLLIDRVCTILKLAKMPPSLEELGFEYSDIQSLASDASEQWTARFNPRSLRVTDFENLYSLLFTASVAKADSFRQVN